MKAREGHVSKNRETGDSRARLGFVLILCAGALTLAASLIVTLQPPAALRTAGQKTFIAVADSAPGARSVAPTATGASRALSMDIAGATGEASAPANHPISNGASSRSADAGAPMITLVAKEDRVGWASELDGRIHFVGPDVLVGVHNGYRYQGVLLFDLSQLPVGSKLTDVALALTVSDGAPALPPGEWRAELLPALADSEWLEMSESSFSSLPGVAVGVLRNRGGSPRPGETDLFQFDASGIAALEDRSGDPCVAVRLQGPTGFDDELAIWASGRSLQEEKGGEPELRIHLHRSVPTATPMQVIITSTPTPVNVLTAAANAYAATATALAAGVTDVATPLPDNWVTPVVITSTPLPGNGATATRLYAYATANAFLHGTPTPLPGNVWTATPTAGPADETPAPLLIPWEEIAPAPTATPASDRRPIPDLLRGKIAFVSDRLGASTIFVMDPDGANVSLLTQDYPYQRALELEPFAADGTQRLLVRPDGRGILQLFIEDARYGVTIGLTKLSGAAYDPAWSPQGNRVSFVSTEPGNDEIYTIAADGAELRRLTENSWEWDKHPSWSPDGQQITFYSNRETGRRQIWVMNADGSQPRNLSNDPFENWDPVWIK